MEIVKHKMDNPFGLRYAITFNPGQAPPDFEGTMDALMDAVELHYKKALDYDGMENEYGLKGEVIGLSRKMGKIKKIFWDGKDPIFEGGQEILMDLIGSAALMLRMQKKVKDKYRAEWRAPVSSDKPDFPPPGPESFGC
jgi:hypothetical protein